MSRSPLATRTLRVLAVEDSEVDFELLLLELKRSEYAIHARRVEDERGMRDALAEEAWDLVISDHNLPRFSSAEALETLGATDADIPFIILSGAIGEEAAVEAMLLGADDYIMKGNTRRLVPAIERSLDAATARRDRARAEQAERESERRFAAISANLPGVVVQVTYDLTNDRVGFEYLSGAIETYTGRTPEEATGDLSKTYPAIHPTDRQAFIDHVRIAAASGGGLEIEGRVVHHVTGQERVLLLTATHREDDGKRVIWDGIAIDMTQRHKAEAELRMSQEALRTLAGHMERMKEAERADLARELHDEVGGLLTALKVNCATIARQTSGNEVVTEKLRDTQQLLEQVVGSIKAIARSLRPAVLDHGLGAALEWQARDFEKRMAIPTRFTCNDENLKLDLGQSTGVFRVFQEALTNVAKHAGAKTVDVEVFAKGDTVSLEIRDDGDGLAPASLDKADSFGILGMRERVHRMGGWLEINSAPGRGTTVMLSVPREPPPEKTP